MTVELHTLPECCTLRSTPLAELDAETRNVQSAKWTSVKTWKIGPCAFNELRGAWHEFNVFRVALPDNKT